MGFTCRSNSHVTLSLFSFIIFFSTLTSGQVTYTFSFLNNTSTFGGTNDGILFVVSSIGTSVQNGTICNFNFGALEAAVICYQMGFDPVGFSILDPTKRASGNVAMSDVNCTDSVNSSNLATYNIANCAKRSGVGNIPSACLDHSRDVHLYCPRARSNVTTTATPVATTTTPFPSLNCSAITVPRFRLSNGYYGLLQYSPNNNGTWGTVCVEGMNVLAARLICLGLCNNQNAVIPYAKVVSGIYTADNTSAILMSDLNCKSSAKTLADCSYQNGDGGCVHSQDAGIECGPVPPSIEPIPTPIIVCTTEKVTVFFQTNNSYAYINGSLISLLESNSSSCLTISVQNNLLSVAIPLIGCNPTVTGNETHTMITYTLLRSVYPISNVVYRAPYTVAVSCAIPKNHSDSEVNEIRSLVTGPPIANLLYDNFNLSLYKDSTYSTVLPMGSIIDLQSTVYVRTKLWDSLSTSRLVLQNCWNTPLPSSTSSLQVSIIINKCPVLPNTQIEYYSDDEIRFQFPMLQLTDSNNKPLPVYVVCTGVTCDTRITPRPVECQRSCVRRRRRDAPWILEDEYESASLEARSRRSIRKIPMAGPFYVSNSQSKLAPFMVGLWVASSLLMLPIFVFA